MEKKPTVYIVNDSYQHDYSKARRFGELVSITQGNVQVFRLSRLVWSVREAMKDFKPEDYILLSGTGVLQHLALTEAFMKTDVINILQFGAKAEDYVPMTLEKKFWPGLFNSVGDKNGRNTGREVIVKTSKSDTHSG